MSSETDLLPADIINCMADSPIFRTRLAREEKAIKNLSLQIKSVVKDLTNVLNVASTLSHAMKTLTRNVNDLIGTSFNSVNDETLKSLPYLTSYFTNIEACVETFIQDAKRNFIEPLDRFRKQHVKILCQAKRDFEKQNNRLMLAQDKFINSCCNQLNSKPKQNQQQWYHQSNNMSSVSSGTNNLDELMNQERCVQDERLKMANYATEYTQLMIVLHERKKNDLINCMIDFINAWILYHKQTDNLSTHFENPLNDMKNYMNQRKLNFSANINTYQIKRSELFNRKSPECQSVNLVNSLTSPMLSKNTSTILCRGWLAHFSKNKSKTLYFPGSPTSYVNFPGNGFSMSTSKYFCEYISGGRLECSKVNSSISNGTNESNITTDVHQVQLLRRGLIGNVDDGIEGRFVFTLDVKPLSLSTKPSTVSKTITFIAFSRDEQMQWINSIAKDLNISIEPIPKFNETASFSPRHLLLVNSSRTMQQPTSKSCPSLHEMRHVQHDSMFTDESEVSIFISTSIFELERRDLATQEGIYRTNGIASKITTLINEYLQYVRKEVEGAQQNQTFDISDEIKWDSKTIAGAVKRSIRDLNPTLMPLPAFEGNCPSSEQITVRSCKIVIDELPQLRFAILKSLICHLRKVCAYNDKNRMTIENLSVCFGPTIFLPSSSSTGPAAMVSNKSNDNNITNHPYTDDKLLPFNYLKKVKLANSYIEFLIKNFRQIFDDGEEAETTTVDEENQYLRMKRYGSKQTSSNIRKYKSMYENLETSQANTSRFCRNEAIFDGRIGNTNHRHVNNSSLPDIIMETRPYSIDDEVLQNQTNFSNFYEAKPIFIREKEDEEIDDYDEEGNSTLSDFIKMESSFRDIDVINKYNDELLSSLTFMNNLAADLPESSSSATRTGSSSSSSHGSDSPKNFGPKDERSQDVVLNVQTKVEDECQSTYESCIEKFSVMIDSELKEKGYEGVKRAAIVPTPKPRKAKLIQNKTYGSYVNIKDSCEHNTDQGSEPSFSTYIKNDNDKSYCVDDENTRSVYSETVASLSRSSESPQTSKIVSKKFSTKNINSHVSETKTPIISSDRRRHHQHNILHHHDHGECEADAKKDEKIMCREIENAPPNHDAAVKIHLMSASNSKPSSSFLEMGMMQLNTSEEAFVGKRDEGSGRCQIQRKVSDIAWSEIICDDDQLGSFGNTNPTHNTDQYAEGMFSHKVYTPPERQGQSALQNGTDPSIHAMIASEEKFTESSVEERGSKTKVDKCEEGLSTSKLDVVAKCSLSQNADSTIVKLHHKKLTKRRNSVSSSRQRRFRESCSTTEFPRTLTFSSSEDNDEVINGKTSSSENDKKHRKPKRKSSSKNGDRHLSRTSSSSRTSSLNYA